MFIAEIGINHHGSLEIAKRLVEAASSAKCDAVKFQFRGRDFYKNTTEISDEILAEEIQRTYLSLSHLASIFKFAKSLNLNVGVSFFRLKDFHNFAIHELVDFYKIPSAEHANLPLIDALLETGKRVFLSTGGAELSTLPSILKEERMRRLNVMHCVANYPVALGQEELTNIDTLKEQCWCSVGYSSHDENYLGCMVALGKGINSLERHIVLDKCDGGLDSTSSSTPEEFRILGSYVSKYLSRSVLNKPSLVPRYRNQGEKLNMQNLGTGLYSSKDVKAGEKIFLELCEIKAPRLGLSVGDFCIKFQHLNLQRDLKAGEPLTKSHYKAPKSYVTDRSAISYLKHNKIGLPVRLHDFQKIRDKFPIDVFEFHLSFGEVFSEDLKMLASKLDPAHRYSIHLPDYVSSRELIDLFSDDESTQQKSIAIINRVRDLAHSIEQKTASLVPIVGSFPFTSLSADQFVNNLGQRLRDLKVENCYPQWLPCQGWYFGGNVSIGTFNSEEYLNAVRNHQMEICIDISHLIMSANYHRQEWKNWFEKLIKFSRHMHISDALGIDSEGLPFGAGELKGKSIKVPTDNLAIVEVWQGHLDNFRGFDEALSYLTKEKRIAQ